MFLASPEIRDAMARLNDCACGEVPRFKHHYGEWKAICDCGKDTGWCNFLNLAVRRWNGLSKADHRRVKKKGTVS